jgi:hypothetical protein
VRRAALVHEDLDVRMSANDRPCRAGVIEMDVGQQDLANVCEAQTQSLQPEVERLETSGWPGVDERHACRRMDDGRRDGVGAPEKLQVDPGKSVREDSHGEGSDMEDARAFDTTQRSAERVTVAST